MKRACFLLVLSFFLSILSVHAFDLNFRRDRPRSCLKQLPSAPGVLPACRDFAFVSTLVPCLQVLGHASQRHAQTPVASKSLCSKRLREESVHLKRLGLKNRVALRMADGKEKEGQAEIVKSETDPVSDAKIEELMDGLDQLQTGLQLLQSGLELTASGAQKRFVNEFSAIGDQALKGMEAVIGKEQLTKQLEEAREAVLQNIGISEEDVPEVDGPPFDLSTAIFLAGSAFDSYNDPSGGIVAKYEDGVQVAYTSSRMLAESISGQAHSGVLLIKLQRAELTPGKGVLGSEASKCDPWVRVKVNGAVTNSKTVKNSLSPTFDETLVLYVGPTDTDTLEIQLYDADILLGNDDLRQWTPDPLIGLAELPIKDLASVDGWQDLEIDLQQPEEPMTAADDENQNNPFWAKIPREFLVQSWPSLLSGGAVGGKLHLSAQFLPLTATEDETPAAAKPAATPTEPQSLKVNDWELLSSPSQDVTVDAELFAREHLEKLCYIDDEETDTQAVLWEDRLDKRLIIAFRGTEQIKWKDFLTDALIAQHVFEPGADPDDQGSLPPLLRSASTSLKRKIEMDEGSGKTKPEAGDAGMIVEAGSLGTVMNRMQTGNGVTDMLMALTGGGNASLGEAGVGLMRQLTGNDDYEFGDLSKQLVRELTGKDSYEFGDFTKSFLNQFTQKKEGYEFGDVTKGAIRGLLANQKTEEEAVEEKDQGVMVHIGFLRAYLSIRPRLLNILEVLKKREDKGGQPWRVYVTGHSLGGALATLCAADVAKLYDNEVTMYNFGSPRVGNIPFVNEFNSLVPNAFRVVNDADVVARVPRSRLMNYHHVARTVLVSAKQERGVWVEGESDGVDPLRERWIDLNALVDAEMNLLQALVNGESLGDHMEDAYFLALRQALSGDDKV